MFLTNLFNRLKSFFANPKVQAAFDDVARVSIEAEPIVLAIAKAAPNKTLTEITSVYEKYGVPLAQAELGSPAQAGNLLLNLATELLGNKLPGVSTSTLQAAIQIALVAVKAASAVTTPSA